MRVLDLGHGIPAAFGARLLGDLGADVVKVEAPAGDRLRRAAPRLPRAGHGALFELANWNKRGITLDLGAPAAAAELEELLEGADIVLTGLRPRQLRAWGLVADELLARHVRLVAVNVTSFGTEGPDRDLEADDLILQARSGMMAISGSADRPPLKHGLRTSLWSAGLTAAYAALAGLLGARRTGAGAAIDLSIHECLASELVMNHAYWVFAGAVQGRPPASADPLDGNPLPACDGYLALQTSARQPAARLAELFADPRLADPRFAGPEGRIAHASELRALLAEHLEREPARDLFLRASQAGLLSGVVQGAGDLLDCEQLDARDAWLALDDEPTPSGAPWRLPATLATLSRTPTAVRRRAPALGEHDEEVRAEVPRHRPAPGAGPAVTARRGPLAGLRVIDLSIIFAVPYLGALLADLGAEVIKVEAPGRLDQTRTDWGGYFGNDPGADPWNRTGTFQVVNRGKRSLALDLDTMAGRDVLRRLVASADILIDNFTPRVLRKWDLSYAELCRLNPRLITLSNTGYGSSGPWCDFKAQGTTLEATMGLMAVTGYEHGPPARAGQSVPDFFACWTGLVALCAALLERERSGQGQRIDLGMYQLGPAMVPEALVHRQARGEDPARIGAREWGAEVSEVVACAGGGWLAVSADRAALREALADAELAAWAAARSAPAAAAELQAAGVAAGAVADAASLLADPHLHARGFHEPVAVAGLPDPVPLIGRPFRWSSPGTTVGIRRAAPRFGEANDDILRGVLGLPEEAIAALYRDGVVTDAPAAPPPARPMDQAALLASGVLTRLEALA